MAQEKNYENKIKKFLEAEGAWFVKFFANRNTRKGIPDLLCCINGCFIGIEVKAEDGKPSELQIHHVKKIRKTNGMAFILYPNQFQKFKEIVRHIKSNDILHAYYLAGELYKEDNFDE